MQNNTAAVHTIEVFEVINGILNIHTYTVRIHIYRQYTFTEYFKLTLMRMQNAHNALTSYTVQC